MRHTALGRHGKQVAVACAAATLLAGCSASAQTAPAPPTTTLPPSWLLLDADAHGAIALGFGSGGPDRLRGTSRDAQGGDDEVLGQLGKLPEREYDCADTVHKALGRF